MAPATAWFRFAPRESSSPESNEKPRRLELNSRIISVSKKSVKQGEDSHPGHMKLFSLWIAWVQADNLQMTHPGKR